MSNPKHLTLAEFRDELNASIQKSGALQGNYPLLMEIFAEPSGPRAARNLPPEKNNPEVFSMYSLETYDDNHACLSLDKHDKFSYSMTAAQFLAIIDEYISIHPHEADSQLYVHRSDLQIDEPDYTKKTKFHTPFSHPLIGDTNSPIVCREEK